MLHFLLQACARLKAAVLCAALGTVLAGTAAAQPVVFNASGTWDADAPVSALSAPGASWALSFALPSLVPGNPAAAIGSFSYALGGVMQALAPTSVAFFGAADSGMFDLSFGTGPSFSAYGSDILAGGSLLPGTYEIFVGVDGGLPVGSGALVLTAVPEPASAWSLLLGLAMLAAAAARAGAGAARGARLRQ